MIINGCRYYHTTITTSPFGGQMSDSTLMKVNEQTGVITRLTTEEWNKELAQAWEKGIIDNDTAYDCDYNDPFIDCR